VLRIAWIFKTESVIIPVFVGSIAGSSWVLGWLPMLSRAGLTLAPLWVAPALRRAPRKQFWLMAVCIGMAAPFLLLAWLWSFPEYRVASWFLVVFLSLYFLFFTAGGMGQIAFGSLQGKLIRPARRGRLMAVSGVAGSFLAILAAFLLLRPWLALDRGLGFQLIFAFTGGGFLLAGAVVWAVHEPAVHAPAAPRRNRLLDIYDVFGNDARFRRLAYAAWLHMLMLLLFPHYVSLLKSRFEPQPFDIFIWVVAQNAGAGLFSLVAGGVADRWGNRFALRLQMFAAAGTPLLTLGLSHLEAPGPWCWLTFLALGLTPVVFKTLSNYTLELAQPEDHPRYLSTLSLTLAAPYLLFSLIVGGMIHVAGHTPVFLLLSAVGVAAALATFAIDEPRNTPR